MINNVFSKREMKRQQSDIDEYCHSREVAMRNWLPCKRKPVGVIDNTQQRITISIIVAGEGANEQPEGLLDDNDVKVRMGLKNFFDDKVVFSDVLRKN